MCTEIENLALREHMSALAGEAGRKKTGVAGKIAGGGGAAAAGTTPQNDDKEDEDDGWEDVDERDDLDGEGGDGDGDGEEMSLLDQIIAMVLERTGAMTFAADAQRYQVRGGGLGRRLERRKEYAIFWG